MNRFVIQCSVMALLLLGTLIAGEAYMRSIPNVYAYKDSYMRARHDSIQTLILGNSFSYEGIDPNMLSDAFNLALPSQNPEHDAYLLEHYAPYAQLRTVIIPLAGNLFVDELENLPSLSHRAGYYQIHMGYAKHSALSGFGFEISNLNVCRAKIEAYRKLRAGGRELACDSLGFGPEFVADKRPSWTTDGLGPGLTEPQTARFARINSPYFERIGDFCKRNGVRLIVVAIPQWRTDSPIPPCQSAIIDSMGQSLSDRYGAEYRNYLSDSRFGKDDFFDARHLSDVGARKFTAILRAEMGVK